MRRRLIPGLTTLLVLLWAGRSAASAAPPARTELAQRAKAACALVVYQPGKAFGSAVCVHPSGIFLTTEHGLRTAGPLPALPLILDPGAKTEKVFKAVVLKRDPGLNLALLRVEGAKDLAALALAPAGQLADEAEVVAAVYPSKPPGPGDGDYPAIHAGAGKVRTPAHLDLALPAGAEGGPVLDADGRLAGLVAGSEPRETTAVVAAQIGRFVSRPDFTFTPPALDRAGVFKPAAFQARLERLIPSDRALDVQLVLRTPDGRERAYPMKLEEGVYRATVSLLEEPVAPPALPPLVFVFLIARDGGQEVGRHLAILPVPVPAGEVPRVPICPPVLEQDVVSRKLPAAMSSLSVGGGGRFLVFHLPERKQLAVFDVNEARVVRSIPVDTGPVRFAAGLDKLLVARVDEHVLERWNLLTGEREASVKLPFKGKVELLAMGSASRGPLLIGGVAEPDATYRPGFALVDIDTLKAARIAIDSSVFRTGLPAGGVPNYTEFIRKHFFFVGKTEVRASADGQTFGMWDARGAPNGLVSFVIDGERSWTSYQMGNFYHVRPGPDGRIIYTGVGLYDSHNRPVKADPPRIHYCLPAHHGPYYLRIHQMSAMLPSQDTGHGVAVFLEGEDNPIARLPALQVQAWGIEPLERTASRPTTEADRRVHFVPLDQRLHLIPEANVLVTVPAADRLELHRFDPIEALDRSGVDFLVVVSRPPGSVKKGTALSYSLAVLSRRGGLRFSVLTGPEGMTISDKGIMAWQVPTAHARSEERVTISVRDAGGREQFHSFTVRLRE